MYSFTRSLFFLLAITLPGLALALMPAEQFDDSIRQAIPFTGQATDKNGYYRTPATLFVRYEKEEGKQRIVGVMQWDKLGTVNQIEGEILNPLGSSELVFSETQPVLAGEATPGVRYLIRPEFDNGELILTGAWAQSDGRSGKIKLTAAPGLKGSGPSLLDAPFTFYTSEISQWTVDGLRLPNGTQQANVSTHWYKDTAGKYQQSGAKAVLVFSDIQGSNLSLCAKYDSDQWQRDVDRIDTLTLSFSDQTRYQLEAERHEDTQVVCTINNAEPLFKSTGRLGQAFIGRSMRQSAANHEGENRYLGNFTITASGNKSQNYQATFNSEGLDAAHFFAKAIVEKANVGRYEEAALNPSVKKAIARYSEYYLSHKLED